ncbi:chromosome segregation protein SMC [Xanthomonas cucurbitae]|uniref:Chromosome segregation protein SMC n=1 Tax=Xanthomonas cucurbitae TaxID=56453 RepID=A0A2S7DXK3_9XANT|nr:ATP-binding protein [Xanthomonas cucurbitae]PPU78556.1 chromosome segregation protein SMC [Xanthomonas cucurbitae]WDM81111.1 AAA family ATPase [Xanthomonas cucurbitae]WDM82720.1 AAA family ATPase [Xanthomonas cucurbitae]
MLISRLKLKNWRNFREADVGLSPRAFLIGANASGKSNLLDVFRFLRTVAQVEGGGLQKALKERGFMSKLRSLHARRDPEVSIELEISESLDPGAKQWTYMLAFKAEGKGAQRVFITREVVTCNGEEIISRPDLNDSSDEVRLTQTHMEQINNNARFRELAEFFGSTTYLHLVPQLLKFGEEISGRMIESDPFGQGLLQRIARTPQKTQAARLKRIAEALKVAVPQFSQLQFKKDEVTGAPHLEARFDHWRVNGAWQREEQFSDGTLRLIGLLWALQEGDGMLLLEEPELSLNDAIVEYIPLMIDRVLRSRKKAARQVIVTTHSDNLIAAVSDPGWVLLLEIGENGTKIREPNEEEVVAMENGLNPAEVLLPKTRPERIEQMGLF